ncbi:hypothetical protein MKW92_040515 [Papaver armeniacum]|nr:hypothetical protein MKW92_040515 [Papaver armeniacum]
MGRSYMVLPSPLNPTPKSKIVNALESRPTTGAYTKVSRKPTNHSKFAGKCGVARKIRPNEPKSLNHRSLAWSVVDGNGLNYDSKSATGILSTISSSEYLDDYYYDDDDIDQFEEYDDDEPLTSL